MWTVVEAQWIQSSSEGKGLLYSLVLPTIHPRWGKHLSLISSAEFLVLSFFFNQHKFGKEGRIQYELALKSFFLNILSRVISHQFTQESWAPVLDIFSLWVTCHIRCWTTLTISMIVNISLSLSNETLNPRLDLNLLSDSK